MNKRIPKISIKHKVTFVKVKKVDKHLVFWINKIRIINTTTDNSQIKGLLMATMSNYMSINWKI